MAHLIKVLDPATGDGALLISILAQLASQGVTAVEVHGFETDAQALATAALRIKAEFPQAQLHLTHGDFLSFALDQVRPRDEADDAQAPQLYDIIIANPPYVRTQVIGAGQAQLLSSQFDLGGRVDMYHAFVVAMSHVLSSGGIGGFIVSNRFMTTKSGSSMRQAIRKNFNVREVWDLGDTKIFDAAVLPAVLIVEKQSNQESSPAGFASIYAANEESVEPAQQVEDVLDALEFDGLVQTADGRNFMVKTGSLDVGASADAVWRLASDAGDIWLSTVQSNTWKCFGDIGKIRVGVKTCADKVFIRTDWQEMPEASHRAPSC